MKKVLTKIAAATLLLASGFFANQANANNLVISGTSVAGSNITFNISWDNSWYTNLAPANWDGVWVFVKYQDCATRLWAHAGLSTVGSDHTAGSPLQVDAVSDGKGVFIRRSAFGGGSTGTVSVTLKMTIAAGTYNYKVFGIEMVNCPQGSFDVGDATSTSTFNSISIDATAQSTGLTSATLGGGAVNVPATYPMGYNSFYCMKYEITQEQYVEFLNSLTYDQQKTRTANDPISAAGTYAMVGGYQQRQGIVIATPGNNNVLPAVYACDATAGSVNNANDGQNTPMNWISWADVTAYLDWAALRPMTDMEYEKVCRGTASRVAGEYAWGTTAITQVYNTLGGMSGLLTAAEAYSPVSNGMCCYGVASAAAAYGPLRAGIFATGSSGRASAGAAYYGAMEMSGNLWERVVTSTNATGVAFNGTLGDGTLDAVGDPNQATWPAPNTATGSGYKGGDYYNNANYLRISDRSSVTSVSTGRTYNHGGRGVR